jgi:hypothetical protein
MLVTLRKAKKIQAAIQAAITAADPKLATRIEIPVLRQTSEVEPAILKGREALRDRIRHITRLENIVLGIRQNVGRANAASEINDLVAEQANLKGREKRLARLVTCTPETPETAAQVAEFEATRAAYERVTNSYGLTSQEFKATVVDVELLTDLRVALNGVTRRIADIQDALEDLNKKNTIEISDEDVAYLQAALII